MSKALKVLFLLEDLCYGGTQKQNLELAMRMDRSRFEPAILTLTGRTDLDGRAERAGLGVTRLGRGRKAAPLFFLRLPGLLRAMAPQVLVPCTALPNIWGRLWGRPLGIPVIVGTCRGGGAPKRQHERFLWRLTDHIVCNSRASVEAMRALNIPAGHLSYIPNGVDQRLFCPNPRKPQARLVVCVARLAADKDHRTLLRAFARLAPAWPDLRLRLVGEGPEEAALRRFAQSLPGPELAGRVEFAGASDNPAGDYAQANIFALSSLREGQPNVILEAMSAGLPVCATSVGGIPALVRHGENGLLCPPGDDAALAANIGALLADPAAAAAMGANGRAMVEQGFSFAAMVKSHEDLFLNLWEKYLQKRK